MTALAAFLMLGERPNKSALFGLVAILVGAFMMGFGLIGHLVVRGVAILCQWARGFGLSIR